jgi:hypothetical protein
MYINVPSNHRHYCLKESKKGYDPNCVFSITRPFAIDMEKESINNATAIKNTVISIVFTFLKAVESEFIFLK